MDTPARNALLDLLSRHQPADALEAAHLEGLRHHAQTLERPWSRHQTTAHFTASALVLSADGTRVCLLHHAKLSRWLQPGGHVDSEHESVEEAALREAVEETHLEVALHPSAPRPLDVDIHSIPARKDEPEHLHLDVRFVLVARDDAALRHDPNESHGARWFGWDEALRVADDASLKRLLLKARPFANALAATR